jgi:hypothetical protein
VTDTKPSAHVTPEEFGRMLAEQGAPVADEQAEAAARILAPARRDPRVSERDR